MSVTKNIRGEVFKLVVMLVLERDSLGVPTKMSLIGDDERVRVDGGEEFVTCFVPLRVLEGNVTQSKGSA